MFRLTNLVPGRKEGPDLGRERALSEFEGHSSASVDHEVEPAVLLRHRVAFVVEVGVGHPDPDQPPAGVGQHSASNDGSAARKGKEKVLDLKKTGGANYLIFIIKSS